MKFEKSDEGVCVKVFHQRKLVLREIKPDIFFLPFGIEIGTQRKVGIGDAAKTRGI